MPEYVLNKIAKILEKHNISSDRVGLYGLTYKPNVDDTRESPTLQLLEKQNHPDYTNKKVAIIVILHLQKTLHSAKIITQMQIASRANTTYNSLFHI